MTIAKKNIITRAFENHIAEITRRYPDGKIPENYMVADATAVTHEATVLAAPEGAEDLFDFANEETHVFCGHEVTFYMPANRTKKSVCVIPVTSCK